jgi:2'-5' RNA ligase superfamily
VSPQPPERVQLRIELSAALRALVEPLRARWNPERALGNPAHVTAIYHDEASDPGLLWERAALAAARLAPFELAVHGARRFEPPVRGVFLAVSDASASIARLRESVLAPPFSSRSRFGLHVTVLHPDRGEREGEVWEALSALPPLGRMRVDQLLLVDGAQQTLARLSLGAGRTLSAR